MYWSPTRSRVAYQRARLRDVHLALLSYETKHGCAPASLDDLLQEEMVREDSLHCTCGSRYFFDPRVSPRAPEDSGYGRTFCLRCVVQDRVTVVMFGSGALQEVRNGNLDHK